MEPEERVVLIKYPMGHTCFEKWTKSEYKCPKCAAESVWYGDGDDYYAGAQFMCISCGRSFYFYQEPMPISLFDVPDNARLTQLKASVATP